jgi:large subunit ribosomal protein L24
MSKAKLKLKKGDQVVVLTGKDKGSKGEILSVDKETLRVTVRGVNVVKRHTKPSQTGPGGIESSERSVHISNVALADPKDGKATRVGYKTLKDGKKMRVAKRSGETIE